MFCPPLPIMFLWYLGSTLISAKLILLFYKGSFKFSIIISGNSIRIEEDNVPDHPLDVEDASSPLQPPLAVLRQ